jgi:hypothetical protein
MAQNRNDQNDEHDQHEESEYRFSDDEISYEVEEGEPAKAHIGESKKEFKLSRFKRLIISMVAFLVLFVVVYKMLAPPSTTIPEIASAPPASAIPSGARQTSVTAAEQPIQNNNLNQTNSTLYQTVGQNQTTAAPLPGQIPIPMTSTETDTRLAAMAVENEKRINQLSADYNQKLNDFATQNKLLQDQVQLLTAKIGSIETQMTQLVQVLIRQGQNTAQPAGAAHTNAGQAASDAPVPYNVQAIIPGRAWLKSDNGETVTVAEGDTIKGLGRVTKIDPYDGIVEVNTGSKALSLSYGSNG